MKKVIQGQTIKQWWKLAVASVTSLLLVAVLIPTPSAHAATGDPYFYKYAHDTKRPYLEFTVGNYSSPTITCQNVNVRIFNDNRSIDRTFTTANNGTSGEVRKDSNYPSLNYTFELNLAASFQNATKATLGAGKFNTTVSASSCTSGYTFSKTFMDAIWIVPPACMDNVTNSTICAPLHRFYNTQTGAHFYTADENEKRSVLAMSQYRYEGITSFVQTGSATGRVTVQRFYHKTNGTHFYTASQSEANNVINNQWRTYSYEGAKYSAYPTQQANTVAFHRFYKFKQGVHFYTTSASEAHAVRTTMANEYRYEGVSYYNINTF